VREHHDIAQRQHRVGPDLAGREGRAWFCRGHGPKSLLLSPSATTRQGAVRAECQWAEAQREPRCTRGYDTLPGIARMLLGGARPRGCQLAIRVETASEGSRRGF